METVEIVLKAWPIFIVIVGLLIGIGIHQQKFQSVENEIRKQAINQVNYLLKDDHAKMCRISQLELTAHFDKTIDGFKDTVFPEIRKIKDETMAAVSIVRDDTLKAVNDVKTETIQAIQREFRNNR